MNVKELMNSVVELNKKIESVNKERTRVETQRDMLNKQLISLLDKYKAETGVSLSGKTLEETQRLVQLEFNTVFKRVSEEYEFKNKVVQLISEGRYDEANNALKAGVVPDEPVKQNTEVVEITAQEQKDSEDDVVEFSQPVGVFATNSVASAFSDMKESNDDEIDFGFSNIKAPVIQEDDSNQEEDTDDFDDDDFGFGDILNGSNFLM